MKKLILIIVAVSCLIGGLLFSKIVFFQQDLSPSVFLPQDTIVYVHQKNLAPWLNGFMETPMGQALRSVNFVEVALDVGMSLDHVESLRTVQDFFHSSSFPLVLQTFLKDDVTLALFNQETEGGYKKFLLKNLMVVAKVEQGWFFKEAALNIFGKKQEYSSTLYGGYRVHRISLDNDVRLSVAQVEGSMLVALDERTLRQALDRYDRGKVNLSENFFFAELGKTSNNADLFGYFSINTLRSRLLSFVRKDSEFGTYVSQFLAKWQGVAAGGFYSRRNTTTIRNVVTFHFNGNKLNSDVEELLTTTPGTDSYRELSPADTLLYYWTNTFDPGALWKIYKKELQISNAQIRDFENIIARTTGLSFEDLLDLAGENVHFILRRPSPVDPVPVPNFTIIIALKDPEKAKAAMRQFFFQSNIPHKNDKHQGIPFTYWGEGMQQGLQPVYAFHDEVLFLSSSIKMQLDVIDAMSGGIGMTSRYQFRQVGEEMRIPSNSFVYIQMHEALEILKKFVVMAEAMFALQNRQAAYTSEKIVKGVVMPLLDGMKMYSHIATRSVIGNGTLTIETNISTTQTITE